VGWVVLTHQPVMAASWLSAPGVITQQAKMGNVMYIREQKITPAREKKNLVYPSLFPASYFFFFLYFL
jgi:hypothetical protein